MKTILKWLPFALCFVIFQARAETIHVVTETTPYGYLQGERVVGRATEVVKKTLALAGLQDYSINIYPWARAYDMALKEPNTLIYLIARTTAREQQFKWVGEIRTVEYHLYRLKRRIDITATTLDDVKHYVVGASRDDVRHQYLKSKDFTRVVVSAQPLDVFRMLTHGQIDVMPFSEDAVTGLCIDTGFDCSELEKVLTLDELSTGLYMAYSHNTANNIVDRTRTAFNKLVADGSVKSIMQQSP